MTIHKSERREFEFECDKCGYVQETERIDFHEALDVIMVQKWRCESDGDEWFHYCEECR